MKKFLALFLSIIAISSALVACNEGDDADVTTGATTQKKVTTSSTVTTTSAGITTTDKVTTTTASPTTSKDPEMSTAITTVDTPTTNAPAVTTSGKAPEQGETPHVHAWSEWKLESEPTCTENGSRSHSCTCGQTESETVTALGHNYVNGVCTVCGAENFSKELKTLDISGVDNIYYCSDDLIVFSSGEKSFVADRATGKILGDGYGSIKCAGTDGYVVAYNISTEITSEVEDEDYGTLRTYRTTTDSYVLDKNGKVIYSARYVAIGADMGSTTYEGEYIHSCNEGRIISVTSNTHHFGMAHSSMTVHIRDLSGNVLATHKDIRSLGTFIGGELIMLTDDSVGGHLIVVGKNGEILRRGLEWEENMPIELYDTFFPSGTWSLDGFIDGYTLIETDNYFDKSTIVISSDLTEKYYIKSEYLASKKHHGKIVASKIINNGALSEGYYLIDLAKCEIGEDGFSVPTLDAAITGTEYDGVYFSDHFGTERYFLVSRGGKWGYLSVDGKTEKLYDDAGSFFDGIAIVKDGNEVYVIDENLDRISKSSIGYDSIYSAASGVFGLKKDGKTTVAVYDN